MKSTINISLDTEIIENLRREDNYSDLINREMKGYYNAGRTENINVLKQNLVKIKDILKINNKKRRLIDKKLLKILKKEKKTMKNIETNREKLIQKVIQERKRRKDAGRKIKYYISPEDEVDRALKGGETDGKKNN